MIKETCLNPVCLLDSLKIIQATFSSGEMSTVNVTSQDMLYISESTRCTLY